VRVCARARETSVRGWLGCAESARVVGVIEVAGFAIALADLFLK
jgi:hypothetical protein